MFRQISKSRFEMRAQLVTVLMTLALTALSSGSAALASPQNKQSKSDADTNAIGHRRVSVGEAKNLVLEALPRKARHLPSLSLEGGLDPAYPGFYVISVMWAGAPDGSVVYGNYAVDASTGDVFDAVSECTEISTPSLRKLQAEIRSRIGLSDSEYHKIKSEGPLCQQNVSVRSAMCGWIMFS